MPFRAIARGAVDAYHDYRERPLFNAGVNATASALTYGVLRNAGELVGLVTGYNSQELNTIGDMLAPIVSSALLSYSLDRGPLPASRFGRGAWNGFRDITTALAAGAAGYVAASDLMQYRGNDQLFQIVRDLYYNLTFRHPELVSGLAGFLGRAWQLTRNYGRERNAEIQTARIPGPNPQAHP